MNEIEKLQKKLIELTKRHLDVSGYGKLFEPTLTIGIDNELKWFAEIYSYQMDFHTGGRHHYFYADSFDELIEILWDAVKKEEEKLIEIEKVNGQDGN